MSLTSHSASEDPLIVATGPGGAPAALPASVWLEGEQRAAKLGLGQPTTGAGTTRTEPLMDSKQLGALLGVNETTVEAMARDGRLPSIRIGRLLRFEPAVCVAALRVNDGW